MANEREIRAAPLAESTLRRIGAGLQKYVLDVSDEAIRALHREAETAGDVDQVRLCAYALGWAPCSDGMRGDARAECARVIRAAR